MTLRIAHLSDLHLEFRSPVFPITKSVLSTIGFPAEIDADVIIIAGDTHPEAGVRAAFFDALQQIYGLPVLHVLGNHDVYHGWFPNPEDGCFTAEINGVRIAGATLWTQLSPLDVLQTGGMNDFRCIRDISLDRWNAAHAHHVDFLRAADPHVMVTHHLPTPHLIAPQYAGSSLNAFFASPVNLYGFDSLKLAICGHTHTGADIMLGGVNFLVNPLGYPREGTGSRVKITTVEV